MRAWRYEKRNQSGGYKKHLTLTIYKWNNLESSQTMNSKDQRWFYQSAAVLLLVTAAAKLYSAGGAARILGEQDELLHLGYRPLMICSAALEIAVALYLRRSQNGVRRSLALLWLSANFITYHLGNHLLGFHTCPCIGRLSDRLPLPHGMAEVILQVLVLFWFAQSLAYFSRDYGAERWMRLVARVRRLMPGAPLRRST